MKKVFAQYLLTAGLMLLFAGVAIAGDDIREFPSCKYCNMNRELFSQTRMVVEYEDGSKAPFCSLHCASVDMAVNIDKSIKALWVGDYYKKDLINAYDAFWVLGANIPGVMTKRSKVAFMKKEDAEKFQKDNGGELVDSEKAVKAAYEDMYSDTQMIRERKRMKKMKHMEHNQ